MIAVGAGICIGTLAARRVNSPFDRAVVCLSLVVYSMPNFVWGFLLILVSTTVLYQLTGGLIFYDVGPCCQGAQVLMPAFALGAHLGYIARHTRASQLDEVQTEYATTARAKGLTEAAVIRRHALRGVSCSTTCCFSGSRTSWSTRSTHSSIPASGPEALSRHR